MQIAVIGAGFSGLAISYYLSSKNHHVTIFDQNPIGNSTSGISAGLLHPYAGADAKLNHRGLEAFAKSVELIELIQAKTPHRQIIQQTGILRLATTEKQKQAFSKSPSLQMPENEWLSANLPGECLAGILLKKGLVIDSKNYLQSLWEVCQMQNSKFVQQKINCLSTLVDFEKIILASGANIAEFKEASHLFVKKVKGQVLEAVWPKSEQLPEYTLNGKAYIIIKPGKKNCIIGSTYEKEHLSLEKNIEIAKAKILPNVAKIIPSLETAEIVDCMSGVRGVSKDHLPIYGKLSDKVYVIGAMGSKGLLYHALVASELSSQI